MQLFVLSISTCFEGGHPLHLSLVLKEGRESLLLFVSAPVGNCVIIYFVLCNCVDILGVISDNFCC